MIIIVVAEGTSGGGVQTPAPGYDTAG